MQVRYSTLIYHACIKKKGKEINMLLCFFCNLLGIFHKLTELYIGD